METHKHNGKRINIMENAYQIMDGAMGIMDMHKNHEENA